MPVLDCSVEGPFYGHLAPGERFTASPSIRLTDGMVAVHRSIVGGRTALELDHDLAAVVTGIDRPLVPPALVWDVAIGQSSVATHEVVANLYYRDLQFRHTPRVGDTLHTTTTVASVRPNRPKPGRRATGLAELRIRTVDQEARPVLDFARCAMLPLAPFDVEPVEPVEPVESSQSSPAEPVEPSQSSPAGAPGPPSAPTVEDLTQPVRDWDLAAFRAARAGRHFADLRVGERHRVAAGDVVSSAPELARLTLNIAAVHHDSSRAPGGRLVYGGHVIDLALHQIARCLPNLMTVLAWTSCDHLAPVHEGATIRTTVEVERLDPWSTGGLVHLRAVASARSSSGETDVLDWRLVALLA